MNNFDNALEEIDNILKTSQIKYQQWNEPNEIIFKFYSNTSYDYAVITHAILRHIPFRIELDTELINKNTRTIYIVKINI